MELSKVRALFLVLTPTWMESVQPFVVDRLDPQWRRSINEFTDKLKSVELPVFMDRSSLSDTFLGTSRFEKGEIFDDFAVSASVVTKLWHPKGFLLSLVLNPDDLNRLTAEQRLLIQESFGQEANDLLRRSLPTPPRYLGEIVTFIDPSLEQVKDQEALRQYCESLDVGPRDVFWGGTDHNVLFLTDPGLVNAASHELIAVHKSAADSVNVEMGTFLRYIGTRSLEDLTVDEAEDETKKALSLRSAIQKARTAPSWHSLLASIHPRYRDPFDEVNKGIGVINNATQQLAKLKTDLYGLRQVYESNLWWGDGHLTLAQSHVARGDLIAIQDGEIGTLTLTAYVKRSALNILNFYIQRIDNSMAEMSALLSALNTAASIKSAEQAEILNKLILILTVVSAELALLQVISATNLWRGPSPIAILFVFLAIDLAAVILAYRSDQRRRSR